MNKEEAIKNIVSYIYFAEDIPEEVGKAFDVAITALKEKPHGEWITDRVPSYTGLCLISIDALVTVANFDGTAFRDRDSSEEITINAWQPLPEPYKKGGTE